ncbi:MAG: phytanoyl-CoA dioxygenase family protein [Alphaproteobacteria bacterium]|nr:phytanoyl-CoA dioxygenase family protein [Alphaproteobacteria bacterium]MBV8407818.1 phytanoyl-CoA dioxygenase family protein [Alphaproteobacteria bacterium]
MLSDRQIETYRRDGYLVVPRLIEGQQLADLRALTERIVQEARGVSANDELYDLEATHTAALPRVRRLKPVIFKRYAFFHALARDSKITSILAQLLGPNIRQHGGKLNMKSAGYGSPVEWHQDWAFYPHTNDDVLATGIYLDDCDGDNGPLMVLPGTHLGPTHDHHVGGRFCGAMDPATSGLDFDKAVPLMGPAGSMTIHHARLVHGSALNRSNRQRRLLLHEYTAADAWPLLGVADFTEFNSRIVLGEPTIEPRVVAAPIRMPLPPADHQGSIYENQRGTSRRFFETYDERVALN